MTTKRLNIYYLNKPPFNMQYVFVNMNTNLQKFDVLPFHGMLQFEKLKLSLSNARDELKTGKVPESETLDETPHYKAFKL